MKISRLYILLVTSVDKDNFYQNTRNTIYDFPQRDTCITFKTTNLYLQ